MFSDPNYESKSGKIMEMVADTPNVNKAMQTRSIKNMGTFKRLRGFKKEEDWEWGKAISHEEYIKACNNKFSKQGTHNKNQN